MTKNREVLVSNLEVIRKELVKAESVIGKEYALNLEKSAKEVITKEEFYYESLIMLLMDAVDDVTAILGMLTEHTPESLVEIAKEDGQDFKEISKEMKKSIVIRKMESNPLVGALATLDALAKMASIIRD